MGKKMVSAVDCIEQIMLQKLLQGQASKSFPPPAHTCPDCQGFRLCRCRSRRGRCCKSSLSGFACDCK
jgi:hypothetical protein